MAEVENTQSTSGLSAASSSIDRMSASYNAYLRAKTPRSFTLSLELALKLEELATESGHSESEILQAGISLVELAVKAREKGKKFGVVEQDTPLVTEVVGL